jgi:DNA-binding protein H-NS
MASIDLAGLSIKELRDLISRANTEISKKEKAKVVEARAKIAEIADEYGVSLDELIKASGKVRGSRSKAAPKYRNPKDSSQTWAGRGRKPAWLEAELKKGAKLDSYLIR